MAKGKSGGICVAFALLLTLAVRCPSGDAQLAGWNSFSNPSASSGKISSGYVDEVFENVDVPFNELDHSVRQQVDSPLDGDTNTMTWDEKIELPPGFEVLNNISLDVHIRCATYRSDTLLGPLVLETTIPAGQQYGWTLQEIDPGQQHIKYPCRMWYQGPYWYSGLHVLNQYVWANSNNQNVMPLYCVHCIFALQTDGCYAYNIQSQVWVRTASWS